MTKDELEQMVHDEEERLGIGSSEFMQRHQEVMKSCSALLKKGGERICRECTQQRN